MVVDCLNLKNLKIKNMWQKIQKRFFHDFLGWGYPNGLKNKDIDLGFQDTYNCKFCDEEITQDSTGAWFHL
jgi:hypothetical protein